MPSTKSQGVGLGNMIKILVFDEAGNVTEKKTPKEVPTGGSSANVNIVGDHNTVSTAGRVA